MQMHYYSSAERWLDAARDQVIVRIEKMGKLQRLGRFDNLRLLVGIKLRCIAAAALSLFYIVCSWFSAVWCSLDRSSSAEQKEDGWDELEEAIDLFLAAVVGVFDHDTVLTAVDRSNIRRIHLAREKMRDVMSHPNVTAETKREIGDWYHNASVFVRTSRGEAGREIAILVEALDYLQSAPTLARSKLKGWRWEKNSSSKVGRVQNSPPALSLFWQKRE